MNERKDDDMTYTEIAKMYFKKILQKNENKKKPEKKNWDFVKLQN